MISNSTIWTTSPSFIISYISHYYQLIALFGQSHPKKESGLERHHIIPRSEQLSQIKAINPSFVFKKEADLISSDIIYVSPAEHAYLHYIYDLGHGSYTSRIYMQVLGYQLRGSRIYSLEDFYQINSIWNKRNEAVEKHNQSMWSDPDRVAALKANMSKAHFGKPNCCRNRIWIYREDSLTGDLEEKRINFKDLPFYEERGFNQGRARNKDR